MTKQRNLAQTSSESGKIFGLSCTRDSSRIVLTPVPWEVTTSYGSGTSNGPEAILQASPQIDLYDSRFGEAYKAGYFWDANDFGFRTQNDKLKKLAQKVITEFNETGDITSQDSINNLEIVNAGCADMVKRVYERTSDILDEGKIPGLVGGDHSTPLGAIRAICERYAPSDVGILHIDAHADLRLAYQGFLFSHASIMRNVCQLKTPPKKLVQVAIRDYCSEEKDFILDNKQRIHTYFDTDLKRQLFSGTTWRELCEKIVNDLPNLVYVSFDIDGLSPELCPHTGTPVAGGLSFDQASYLFETLGRSGKTIVGFDLNEVAPGQNDEWDGNVGARILFQLCGWAATTKR